MAELERRLVELGGRLEVPETPPLAARVGAELRAGVEGNRPDEAERLHSRPVPRLRLALLVALAALLLAAGAVAAVPSTRHAVLEFLGLRGETIERVPQLPENIKAKPNWKLGRPTTVAAARHGLVFDPLLPFGIEGPNGVFLDSEITGGALNLTYPPQPGLPRSRLTGVGLLIDELNGQAAPGFYGKLAPRDARFQRFRFRGQFAVWVEGLHAFLYKPHVNYTFTPARSRLAANALLVQRGEVLVRLEGKFDKATALAIARSLRP
jgi:hypothetical protein